MDLLRHGLPGYALMWDFQCSPFDVTIKIEQPQPARSTRIQTSVWKMRKLMQAVWRKKKTA